MSPNGQLDQVVETPRPTLRAAAPFVTLALLGLASVFLPPYNNRLNVESLPMVAAFALALVMLVVGVRREKRTWVDAAAPLLFFVVIALARDLTNGSESGLGPMVALPLLWLALTGTVRELLLASGLTVAVFAVPALWIGEPAYEFADVRKAIAWGAFGLLVSPTVQRLVRQLATESAKERIARAELDGVMRGATLSSMIATDRTGLIKTFGVGAQELLGYRCDEVEGLLRLEIFHDESEVVAVAQELGVEPGFTVFAELARRREPSRIWTCLRADGERVFVRLAITELHDAEGMLTGYLGIAIDSTASVESERALSASEARWRVLMDNLADTTVVMLDNDLRIRVVSGRGAMRQGLDDSVGKLLPEVSNEANMAVWMPMIEAAFQGNESRGDISSAITGAEHEVVVTPLPPDHDGQRVLILGRNVSKERERERALTRAKERAELLFANAPHGVALLTRGGVAVQVNRAMESIVGDRWGDLVGKSLADLNPELGEAFKQHLDSVHKDDPMAAELEWGFRDPQGRDLHLLLSSRSFPGIDGGEDLVLVNVVDVSDRQRHQRELAHMADHDPLTGLANRRRFEEMLQAHLQRCDRYGPTGAVLLLDLDDFKEVNDTLGHGAGDELLVAVSSLLTSVLRESDVVARLGGDEFAILLPEADEAAAKTVAQTVVEKLREYTSTLEGPRRRVTASAGVVTMEAASHQSMDVLALADMTMYDAKEAGRNQFATLASSKSGGPRTAARLEWKTRIEKALEGDGFCLRFQPILDLATNEIVSAEVLLRMVGPDGDVRPAQFLGVAERAGLAPAVDMWVLKHSIAALADLRVLRPDFQLEVNLSGHSIGNAAIEQTIVNALKTHQVEPHALVLEITETVAVADLEVARLFADRMTALGCKFALDDFGAGFGSFYYLKHLVFDLVKIDGEFVENCHRNAIDRTIIRSIVGIARDLDKRTVAEFVADQASLDVVRSEGVDFAQGYFIGRPVPFDEFASTCINTTERTGI